MGRRDRAARRLRDPRVAARLSTRVRAWLEVQHAEDVQDLLVTAEAEITWLVRDDGAPMAVDAVRAARLPATASPYAWIAGSPSA